MIVIFEPRFVPPPLSEEEIQRRKKEEEEEKRWQELARCKNISDFLAIFVKVKFE
jgi:hypothetical protein